MKYNEIFERELSLNKATSPNYIVSLDWIKDNFSNILKESGIDPDEILFAYLLGSHAKRVATEYSDIDFNFYTKTISKDVWFMYQGQVISIFVDKITDIEDLIKSSPDVIWYKELFKTPIVYIDKSDYLHKFQLLADQSTNNSSIVVLNTQFRKVIEYRRKLYSYKLSSQHASVSDLVYIDFAKKYFDNYMVCIAYRNKISISSESNYINEVFEYIPSDIQHNFLELFNINLSLDVRMGAIDNTYKFFVMSMFGEK